MKYYLNKRKLKNIWEKVEGNEIDIDKLKEYQIISKSINSIADLKVFTIQDWLSIYEIPESREGTWHDYIYKIYLGSLPEKYFPFLEVNILVRTSEGLKPTLAIYANQYGRSLWKLSYFIRKMKDFDEYYLWVYFTVSFTPSTGDFKNQVLPLDFKLIGSIYNPEEYNEVSSI